MKLIVNEYGSVIRKEENRFIVVNNKQKQEFSADDISQILITSGTSISSGVINMQ